MNITIQCHFDGAWHTAMDVTFDDRDGGHRSSTLSAYRTNYWSDRIDAEGTIDDRAVSIAMPLDLGSWKLRTWPAFLLDMLPQGDARDVLVGKLGYAENDERAELSLLLGVGGSPIGNLRVHEAWQWETSRLSFFEITGLSEARIASRDELFIETLRRYALLSTGSSGIGGVWPKVMLARSRQDGLFYPDSVLPDVDAVEHVIVKTTAAGPGDIEHLILSSEAPYLEVARSFGIRCGAPLRPLGGSLLIPRFDRKVSQGQVIRHGQESLVSACGLARFGHATRHEEYLAVIARSCSDPSTEVVEYVMRDLLATVMGDTDNHGRNTAFQKQRNLVRLTPLFDFAPMRLDRRGIVRSTVWGGFQHHPPLPIDIRAICETATQDVDLPPQALLDILKAKAPMYRAARDIARAHGVPDEVIRRAVNGEPLAAAIEAA